MRELYGNCSCQVWMSKNDIVDIGCIHSLWVFKIFQTKDRELLVTEIQYEDLNFTFYFRRNYHETNFFLHI